MKKSILFMSIIFLTTSIYAQEQYDNHAIVHINGLNTTFDGAVMNQLALKNQVQIERPNYSVNLAYNKKSGFLKDILQVATQKFVNDTESDFWKLIDNYDEIQKASLISDETYKKYIDQLKNNESLIPEIEEHLNQYTSFLDKGQNVVLVPHSQGNFYGNASLNLLLAHSKQARNQIYSVGLASPSENLLPNSSYYTSSNDFVIRGIGVFIKVLPHNVTVPFSFSDLSGHSFVETYLRQGKTRKLILDKIFTYADQKKS
ncbi:hypothetical protein [Acinetobacter sp. 1125_18A]|uniref:hypothetical protein n=1 Tax=Acinetobacter sp. 1125_18A TaxID=2605959 RepID=UPI0040587C96